MWQCLVDWARAIKRDAIVLWLAARDPHVPMLPKLLAGLVAIYAFSPIDLIPDFIPVLGYLDDILIVPLGIAAVVKMLPDDVLQRLRVRAVDVADKPRSRAGAIIVIAIWALAAVLVWRIWVWK